MRCAEDPATRREGAFELHMSALREQGEKGEADRRATAGEPLASLSRKLRDQEPFFAALLTSEQRQRLVSAVLKSEELVDGDFELIRLCQCWNDPRLLPFLVSYLRRFEETAPESLSRIMQTVAGIAELLDDPKVTALLRHYVDNTGFADIEVGKHKVENADSDEDEHVDSEDEVANEDETIGEVEAAPKITPEAAKQARVEMLKKFLEAVEARLKVAPAT